MRSNSAAIVNHHFALRLVIVNSLYLLQISQEQGCKGEKFAEHCLGLHQLLYLSPRASRCQDGSFCNLLQEIAYSEPTEVVSLQAKGLEARYVQMCVLQRRNYGGGIWTLGTMFE